MKTTVYHFGCFVDGERTTVNVWAFSRSEAVRYLLGRFAAEGGKVTVDRCRVISRDGLDLDGTVLVLT